MSREWTPDQPAGDVEHKMGANLTLRLRQLPHQAAQQRNTS